MAEGFRINTIIVGWCRAYYPSKAVDEGASLSIIPEHLVSEPTADVEITIRPKGQARGPGQSSAEPGDERVDERSGLAIEAEHGVTAKAADVQIPVRAEDEVLRLQKSVTGGEDVDEVARPSIITEHFVGILTTNIEVIVRTAFHVRGRIEPAVAGENENIDNGSRLVVAQNTVVFPAGDEQGPTVRPGR